MAEQIGLTAIEQSLQDTVGLNRAATEALLRERYGPEVPTDAFLAATRKNLQARVEQDCPLKPGVKELLIWLKRSGIPAAMATSSRRSTAEERLIRSGLLEAFQVIVGGDMVQNSKPHPEPYLTACRMLGVAPEQAVGVEDSPNGIRSVYAAGLKTVIIPDTIAPTPELTAMAWRVCPSLYDLLDILKAM